MTHRELVLAAARAQDHAEWMVWAEPVLGAGTRLEDRSSGEARPDLLLIRKSWARYEVRIIEVKVTQSDLEQDVKKLKFEKYFPWAHRVSFLCGPGVKHDSLIPHPVGIQRWVKDGPQTRRAAPLLKKDPPALDMTRSFEMFHALNMNQGRFRHDSRDERKRDARMELDLVNLGAETKDLWKIKRHELKEMLRAAKQAARPREEIEKAARREIRSEFRQQLKEMMAAKSWGSTENLGETLATLVRTQMEIAERSVLDTVREMVKVIEKEGDDS